MERKFTEDLLKSAETMAKMQSMQLRKKGIVKIISASEYKASKHSFLSQSFLKYKREHPELVDGKEFH